jgi:hypothetical protein
MAAPSLRFAFQPVAVGPRIYDLLRTDVIDATLYQNQVSIPQAGSGRCTLNLLVNRW